MALTQNIQIPTDRRPDQRKDDELRAFSYVWNIAPNAEGSILLKAGQTHVICSATIQQRVPRWILDQNIQTGWLTAEYSMLPYSTDERKDRELHKGHAEGRTQEIQRLIGRSLRAAVDLSMIKGLTIWIDCDVVSADGGTRTTAITGSYLALYMAVQKLLQKKTISHNPIKHQVAATSVGVCYERTLLDLAYTEDRDASVDMNLVMLDNGRMVEIQATGEHDSFSGEQFQELLTLAQGGIQKLFQVQKQAIKEIPAS